MYTRHSIIMLRAAAFYKILTYQKGRKSMGMTEIIEEKLRSALNPEVLEVVNESALHAGHAGHDGAGESHFRVLVVSDAFRGMTRVDRQRRVYDLLQVEISQQIHALAMELRTLEEYSVANCKNNS
ncbi:Cell division protein BolA [Micavibrio aeruginosavorus EPB]|uniref:Cell division protein BolA n=2 Tax=Micavibrio aeruginosavorus TaxID=349221 RepID=M4VG68_9BACT|nr:Cell division protein BolA [Micavibrio aeruginosavorus EPB]